MDIKWILKIPPHLSYVATLHCGTLMSAKQTNNNNFLRCGGVINNQIKKDLL